MIVIIRDIHERIYSHESPHTNIKSVIESIFKTNGFLEVEGHENAGRVKLFLAIDKIVSIRELTKSEISDNEFWKF